MRGISLRFCYVVSIILGLAPVGATMGVDPDCTILVPEGSGGGVAGTNTWTNGIIPYEFDPGLSTSNRDNILAGMAEWSARANIQFVASSCDLVLDCVYITNDLCPGALGCSIVGMNGGRQRFKGGANIQVARHELGHLLGMHHEQQRSDRDEFVQIDVEVIDSDLYENNYGIVSEGMYGPYDFMSVMHYKQCAGVTATCSATGCPSLCRPITVLPDYDQIKNVGYILGRPTISFWDTYTMRQLYGAADCNNNGVSEDSESFQDCNSNNVPDECDLALNTEADCNGNSIPDSCELDCDVDGVPDECEILAGTAQDCNANGIPDECIGAGIVTRIYDVGLADLLHVPSTCLNPFNRDYFLDPCILHPGFRWLDTLQEEPVGVEIAFNVGVEMSLGTVRGTTTNGFTGPVFQSTAQDVCGSLDKVVTLSFVGKTKTYYENDWNVFLITVPNGGLNENCLGFRENAAWGTGVYARVTVTTNSELDCNGNGVPDECECPAATIAVASPPSGVVDARQPNEVNVELPRQGIGATDDPPIRITLDPPVSAADSLSCWSLCETGQYPEGPNSITSAIDLGGGQYEISLGRAITAGAVTTIEYLGDGSFVEFISHPANANADSAATSQDILSLIDYLNEVSTPPYGDYSCDINHSDACNAQDILRLIDLLNGAGVFDPWNSTPLPVNTSSPISCECLIEPQEEGDGTVVAEWAGPTGSPVLGVDYAVDTSVSPPNVTLLTTEKQGTAVNTWFVGCVPDMQPADIGTINTNWASPSNHDVVVEVGTTPGTPCRSVDVIDIPRQSASNWSSIKLQLTGILTSKAQCYASDGGQGGRISGSVAGPASELVAQAIGVGASSTGVLDAASTLERATVQELETQASLQASMLLDELSVQNELHGNIDVGWIWHASGADPPQGQIHIQGLAESTGNITIGFQEPYEGLQGGKIKIEGAYSGMLHINKMSVDSTISAEPPAIELPALNGTIQVDNKFSGSVRVTGSGVSTGSILANEDIGAKIVFSGHLSGAIRADADSSGAGDITGNIIIQGEFSGDVCGNTLIPGGPLPDHIQIGTLQSIGKGS